MIFDRHEHPAEAKLGGPAVRDGLTERNVGERTAAADIGPRPLGPMPVARHLLEQLRSYPRMRDLVFGYLTVQERIARYDDIMADLDDAGEKPDRQFWARLSGRLEGLRADFPGNLLRDPEFEARVNTFDSERDSAYSAAMAGRSPHQSAQSAEAAYIAVTEIMRSAEELATMCKAQARELLETLAEAVNKIFADEEAPREAAAATDRFTDPGLTEQQSIQESTERSTAAGLGELEDEPASLESRGKHFQASASADFQGHLLTKRRAT